MHFINKTMTSDVPCIRFFGCNPCITEAPQMLLGVDIKNQIEFQKTKIEKKMRTCKIMCTNN